MVDEKNFEAELEKELHPEEAQDSVESMNFSGEYTTFKKEQLSTNHNLYEKLCNFSEKIFTMKLAQKDMDSINSYLILAHINATAGGAASLAVLLGLLTIILGLFATFFLGSLMLFILSAVAGIGVMYYFWQMPKLIFKTWRAKASDQLVLAIMYLNIYVEHTSNLEQAVYFTAKHISAPLSLDFMKILWDVEVKKFPSITEALALYAETWAEENGEFVEALHLIESSFYETENAKRIKILEKSVEVILQGTEEHMMHYTHNLQSPVQAVHMLGIVLPVMGMVMLPMVSAFMGASVTWQQLFLMYNIILPVLVYYISKNILLLRPAGTNQTDLYINLQKTQDKATYIGKHRIPVSPAFFAAGVFSLIAAAPLFWFSRVFILTGRDYTDAMFSSSSLYMSLILITAIAISFGAYYYLGISSLLKAKREIAEMEKEFASAIFQLGNRISENIPTEIAFAKIVEVMPESKISNLFRQIDMNIRQRGMSLEQAIFDEKAGAAMNYPSSLIQSVMHIIVEGSKKSPLVVANSLTKISQYIMSVHKVEERLKDLLADTVASMSMQVKMFIPLITGIVVGLSVLTTNILRRLTLQFETVNAGDLASAGVGGGLITSIFQTEYMIPPPIFQFIVGLYLVQVTFVLSYLLGGIINGSDSIENNYALSKNLITSVITYLIVAIFCVLIFGSLTGSIVGAI
jgi:hypothetical protein